jgi:hypothetical protein
VGIHCSEAAQAALNADEALVFDWLRVAICCAAAGEVSLRRDSHALLERSASFRPLAHDGETRCMHIGWRTRISRTAR